MDERFNYTTTTLTDEELIERIDNYKKYQVEAIEAAFTELKSRNHKFGDDEIRAIEQKIKEQKEEAWLSVNQMRRYIVDDPDAPLLYSKRAIYIFTVLCSALFGSILLAINIKRAKKPGMIWVLLFGIGYTSLQIFIGNYYDLNSSFSFLSGLVGGAILVYFMDRFIGKTLYRARPIWVPLIIALVLVSLIVISVILG